MIRLEDRMTVSVADACQLTGLGKTTLYSLMEEGKITSVQIGTKRLFHVRSLARLLGAEE